MTQDRPSTPSSARETATGGWRVTDEKKFVTLANQAEPPLGRLWRDIRWARIGGGTDEMMWEMVATGLTPDHDTYGKHVR